MFYSQECRAPEAISIPGPDGWHDAHRAQDLPRWEVGCRGREARERDLGRLCVLWPETQQGKERTFCGILWLLSGLMMA
jgi:hypothetical protein